MKEILWENGEYPYRYRGEISPLQVCLHSSDMRKKRGPFQRLTSDERQIFDKFYKRLIYENDYTVISAIIDKKEYLNSKYASQQINIYHRAVGILLERFMAHQIFAFIVGMTEFKQHKLSWIHAAQGFSVSNILHL
jgi:hypothetical protein